MIWSISWKNVWRNKTRSLVVIIAFTLGIFGGIYMVAVMVAAMTRSLEQALRSLARCRKKPYMRQGRIDRQRFVQIAKNLSKEVFYKTRDGMSLDVAVEIIIDESGSMSGWLEVQLLALAIGEALTAIHVPFEITGTTTSGHSAPPLDGFSRTKPIIYRHYKAFGEQWHTVRHRIINTSSYTRFCKRIICTFNRSVRATS